MNKAKKEKTRDILMVAGGFFFLLAGIKKSFVKDIYNNFFIAMGVFDMGFFSYSLYKDKKKSK